MTEPSATVKKIVYVIAVLQSRTLRSFKHDIISSFFFLQFNLIHTIQRQRYLYGHAVLWSMH